MKYVLVVLAAILAFGGYNFFFQTNPNSPAPTPTQTSPTQSIETGVTKRYIEYSKTAFDATRNKKRVYFFHAPWCPTCVPANKEFISNAEKIPEDVVLFKTDYDTARELKTKYAVTYQHTFVLVDETENSVKKWNGGGLSELIANTK